VVMCALAELHEYATWLVNSVRRRLPCGQYPEDHSVHDRDLRTTLLALFQQEHRAFFDALMQTQQYAALSDEFGALGRPNTEHEGAYAGVVP